MNTHYRKRQELNGWVIEIYNPLINGYDVIAETLSEQSVTKQINRTLDATGLPFWKDNRNVKDRNWQEDIKLVSKFV